MKVLFVSSGNTPEKISPVVRNQAKVLAEEGVSVEHFGIVGKGFFGYARNVPKLRNRLRNGSFDLLHAHYGLSGLIALVARKKEKLIVSFMGDDLLGSNRPGGAVTFMSRFMVRLNIFFSRHFYDHSIVKSSEMYNVLPFNRMSIIPNGVDLAVFKPSDRNEARSRIGVKPGEKLAIFVGSPDRNEKNYALASEAVSRSAYKDLRLLTVQNIDQNMLPFYYNAADVLLLSSFHEGSPNVIKEAMACNCPVVSTDVGDVRELIAGVEGCYIATYDADDFAAKIDYALMLSDSGKRSGGREKVISSGLDNKSFSARIIEVYNSLRK